VVRHTRSRAASGSGGWWQKKLTLIGLSVNVRNRVNSARNASRLSMAQGREPKPPALETAAANTAPCTPAMGAWMMGSLVPRKEGCCMGWFTGVAKLVYS
jgi:hypothetical protein